MWSYIYNISLIVIRCLFLFLLIFFINIIFDKKLLLINYLFISTMKKKKG